MSHPSFYAACAIGCGLCIALQATVNGRLRNHLADPAWATFFSICGTIICAVVTMLILRPPSPSMAAIRETSWWYWLGGPLGALVVLSGAVITPKLGAATFLAFVVGGQLLCSALLDHFGWMGLTPRPVNPMRLLGIVLVLGGAVLVWQSQSASAVPDTTAAP